MVECPHHKALTPELCVDVLFADGSHDMLLMFSPYEDAPTVMKGTLRSNPETKVVVILKDEVNPEATVSANMKYLHLKHEMLGKLTLTYHLLSLKIVFKSPKAGGCTRFSADIEGVEDGVPPETTCIHRRTRSVDSRNDIHMHSRSNEISPNERTEEEIMLSPRALNPNGYK